MSQGPRWFGAIGMLAVAFSLEGCADPEPVSFSHIDRLSGPDFLDKPKLREHVVQATNTLFGEGPEALRVPEEAGFPDGGKWIGRLAPLEGAPAIDPTETASADPTGEALYRKHCLHCHGVSGDGQGPTASFLYPRPRDYRRGLFKFTSTGYGNKPSRADLERTMREGLEGTSMPAFSAMLSSQEIERVVDYVIFLSMRGEFESMFAEEASAFDDADLESFTDEWTPEDMAQVVFDRWAASREPGAVTQPLASRPEMTKDSIDRGRALYLGLATVATNAKLECAGCHGPQALGDGPSWIDPATFNRYVFGGQIGPEPIEALKAAAGTDKKWSDEWGDPLRPANLNRGLYKGGRRPIDLYWRIANGITGTPMFQHGTLVGDRPEDLWHLVHFVMALPSDSTLLLPRPTDAEVSPSTGPAVARTPDDRAGATTSRN